MLRHTQEIKHLSTPVMRLSLLLPFTNTFQMYRIEVLERLSNRYICWPTLDLKDLEIHSERNFAYPGRNLSSSILLYKPDEQQTYFTNPGPASPLHSSILVTVLASPAHSRPNKAWVENLVRGRLEKNDVFAEDFISGLLVFTTRRVAAGEETGMFEAAQNLGYWWVTLMDKPTTVAIKSGLYAFHGSQLWEVHKAVEDIYGTFVASVRPLTQSSDPDFISLQIAGKTYQTLSAANPCRMDGFGRSQSPFAEQRIVAKDLFRVKGLKISLGSKAYFDSPFNPRGDGYQSPAGSSSGRAAAVAVAGYAYVDIAPSSNICGISKHFDNSISSFDTPYVFSRSLPKLTEFIEHWLPSSNVSTVNRSSTFYNIIYPEEYWPVKNQDQMALVQAFLKDLSHSVGVEVKSVLIEGTWRKTRPDVA
ncbi:hypothetical protein EJ08DRAFT_712437 [Tothia fuscella]|uniref:Amidase domain-containing protein n=1 Tax=Tothia fuscella TaxID=1048955 RepID=A0A9P4TZQ9_9PEZI|nr:hypothetical protein EJ08DRAFT_712437 [Tothia fuscella]